MVVKRKKRDRRKEIIEQAMDLILSKQSRRLTLANVAEKIGVTEGSIYKHFKDKKEIIETMVRTLELDLIPSLAKTRNQGKDPVRTMENLLRSHLSSPKKQKEVALIVSLVISYLGDKRLRKKITKLVNSYIRGVEGIIRQGQEAQIIRKNLDASAAASLFLGLIYWLTFLNYLMGLPKELLDHKGQFWDIYLRGIQQANQKRR
jgi:AcrR family transcriptional regulator